jgi:cell fate regulator YaaT (PSP1 superfamily)
MTVPTSAAIRTVAVRFKTAGKLFYFDANGFELEPDMWVVVDTAKGTEVGRVILPPRLVEAQQLAEPLQQVLRLATNEDINKMQALRNRNKEALLKCSERIKVYQLPMRLVDAEYNHDGTRLTFYFTADNRVDFRQLVRDLASIFRTRIELRQIGVRDKAKIVGGVGRCGLTLCCSTWQTEFPPVSVKTAKDQDLPLNPSRITGECGRILCCLRFEQDLYNEFKADMPKVGERVTGSSCGSGQVIGRNILKGTVNIATDSGTLVETTYKELTREEKDNASLIGGYDLETEDVFELEDEEDRRFLQEN